MTFLYTATAPFDSSFNKNELTWNKYLEWSRLTHLTELVSLDIMLNESLVEPVYDSADDWNFIHVIEKQETGLFTTLDFVFARMKPARKFNLLAAVVEPEEDCGKIELNDFEFVGYDLLDQYFSVSALTNCGGYDETFLPTDLNDKGLVRDFAKAYDIRKRLFENNPDELHADTIVIAIWRHKTIGRSSML